MTREERQALVTSLLESTDGTRADDFAVVSGEFEELADSVDKLTGRIDELETQNGALRKENFKLFSRVGEKPETEPMSQDIEPDDTDYLGALVDENGKWR